MLSGNTLLTTRDIAAVVGISDRAVRRHDLRQYAASRTSLGGRPAVLYRPDVLTVFGHQPHEAARVVAQPAIARPRKCRRDAGLPRGCTPDEWRTIAAVTFEMYMASAQPNLMHAVRRALPVLAAQGIAVQFDLHQRLANKNTTPDGLYISNYHRENWALAHTAHWRRHNTAKALPTARYNYLLLFEDQRLAGPGFGAHAIWAMDGRKADVWAVTAAGTTAFPYAIYIRDGLTGHPLYTHPCESESAQSIMRALVGCMARWRKTPILGIAMDNATSGASRDVLGVISQILDPRAWDMAALYPEIFTGGSPIIHNLPNIPRSRFKAAVERSFRLIKDEHDATRFPASYQGGQRSEAVQLRVSNQPVITAATPTMEEYWASLERFMDSEFIDRPRPDMYPTLKERGIEPTMRQAFTYYGGYDLQDTLPEGERIAKLLYFAAGREGRAVVKAKLGYADGRIKGELWHVECADLARYYDRKIAIVPFGEHDRVNCVVMLAEDPDDPRYIGMGTRAVVESYSDAVRVGARIPQTQQAVRAILSERTHDQGISIDRTPRALPPRTEIPEVDAVQEDTEELRPGLEDFINSLD